MADYRIILLLTLATPIYICGMKKAVALLVVVLCATVVFSQSKENKAVLEKVMQLNTQQEFKQLAKLFDTAKGRQVPPYLLYRAWNDVVDKFGNYKTTKTLKTEVKNGQEFVIEEFEFDSGYVKMKIGFSANHMITTYMLKEMTSKADRQLEEKYRLPAYVTVKNVQATSVEFGKAPFILKGELTMPKNAKTDVPVVVIVHGSGPGDMNGKQGPQQPYRDIAYGLASKGIAVLRYDKRTNTYADECAEDDYFTVNEETVYDAQEAVRFLHTYKGIDAKRIIVIGHSLGGMMLPRIADMEIPLAGVVFMAAPAKRLSDKIIEQMDYLAGLYPDKKESYEKQKDEFVRLQRHWYDTNTNKRYLPFGVGARYWDDIESYSQTEAAKKMKLPMLFLQGSRDYQVNNQDFELWKEALKSSPNATFRLLNGHTHNMIAGTGKPCPEDYNIPANVSLQVVDELTQWIKGLK